MVFLIRSGKIILRTPRPSIRRETIEISVYREARQTQPGRLPAAGIDDTRDEFDLGLGQVAPKVAKNYHEVPATEEELNA